jgi:hypothetical protein
MSFGKPFVKGQARLPGAGRAKGVKNRLSHKFLEDLAAQWEVSGPAALKIMAVEDPSNFVRVVASLLPKELEITETHLMQIADDELDAFIEYARRRLAERALGPGVRTGETAH